MKKMEKLKGSVRALHLSTGSSKRMMKFPTTEKTGLTQTFLVTILDTRPSGEKARVIVPAMMEISPGMKTLSHLTQVLEESKTIARIKEISTRNHHLIASPIQTILDISKRLGSLARTSSLLRSEQKSKSRRSKWASSWTSPSGWPLSCRFFCKEARSTSPASLPLNMKFNSTKLCILKRSTITITSG